jgi:hypothetical protein
MADEPVSRTERRFELVSTLLLAIAALAAAYSGYQASLWDGIQSSDYSQASALRTRSAQKQTEAGQLRLADISVFENYVDAKLDGDTELAAFYHSRVRDEARPAFLAWLDLDPLNDPDAPPSPLAMPQYVLAAEEEATDLSDQASETFEHGEDANTDSDMYVLTTLFFASVLFLSAVSERIQVVGLRVGLLATSAVLLITGFVIAVTQPVTTG